jgi:fructoselysine 3-epimerase
VVWRLAPGWSPWAATATMPLATVRGAAIHYLVVGENGPGGAPVEGDGVHDVAQHQLQVVRDVGDLTAELGGDRVLYIAGWQIFGVSRRDAWRWSLEALTEIAGHAEGRGITICVEPTSADSNLVDTVDHALELMEECGKPNVKVMFDTFHALYRNEDPSDHVHRMGAHLDHIHMSDHDRLAPGAGGMDFRPVMEALLETGFGGYVTMEIGFTGRSVHPDSIARSALSHLKSVEAEIRRAGTGR